MKDALSTANDNDALEVEITSEGGDVFSGIQISNMLARHKGKVTTHGVGLVASIATVILMSGDEVTIDENCFAMIHNPWTMAIGNANDLQKEIDTLEKCKAAMMGYYRRHAKVDEATIEQYLDAETWFLGTELAEVFDVRVIECDEVLDIAAKFDLTKFKNIPRGLTMKNRAEQADDEKKVEETEEVVEKKVEEDVEEKSTDEEPETEEKKELDETSDEDGEKEETQAEDSSSDEEQPTVEELQKQIEELQKENEELKSRLAEFEEEKENDTEEEEKKEDDEEVLNKAQVQARISGIQSSMQKQINDFKSQLKAKDEELMNAKADITRLTDSLDKTARELSEMASTLEEKQQALDKLNANVNAHAEELPTMKDGLAKCATPAEKVAFLKSGKYVR